jgi:colicin import membrane protein
MKRRRERRGQSLFMNSPQSDKSGLLRAGIFSLLLHIIFLLILSLSLKSTIVKMNPSVYRVTLRPLLGDGLPKGGSGLQGTEDLRASLPGEKLKAVEKPEVKESKKGEVPPATKKQKSKEPLTRDEVVEGLKRSLKKEEKPEKEKVSSQSLQDALEEIRKKVALDKIQKRIARREELEKVQIEGRSTTTPSQGPIVSSSGSSTGSGPGVGTGTGLGTGPGTDGTGGSPTGSPWGSPFGGSSALQSKLDEYYSRIWEKIKKEWTLPRDLLKGKTELETIIVIIIERDGKIQKSWFEKRSGNALYDQNAMRAIKKADPLPPIPKEFSDNTFEIGIRFYPE